MRPASRRGQVTTGALTVHRRDARGRAGYRITASSFQSPLSMSDAYSASFR